MSKISDLETHLGYWMRMVSNHTSYKFSKKLRDAEVTVSEWVLLRKMYEQSVEISSSEVASLLGITRGAVSKLISRLVDKDLISREEFADDRRYQDIKLTKKAIKLMPKLAKIADANDDEIFSALSKTEKQELERLLLKLVKTHKIKAIPIK